MVKGLYCIFSECSQCLESNQYEELALDPYFFGHLRAIVDSEEEAKRLVEHYNKKYKGNEAFSGFTHFYKEWKENEV